MQCWPAMPAARPLRTTTIPGVELVRAGTWAASTGVTTITLDDLRAMLAAASDVEVDEPAVRIGHVDPRFDGEPALGWVRNLRLDAERGALVGDLEDVPAELAAVIPTAFRRRSVEIAWNYRTPAGKRYRAALTGLALLGVTPPAVKGLADVIARYAADDARRPRVALGAGPADDELFLADDAEGETNTAVAQALATARAALAALPPTETVDLDDPQEVPNVPITDERLRELLGVEADADLEATITTLRTRAENPNPSDPGNGGNGDGEPAAPPAPGSPGAPEPGTPGSPDGGGAGDEGGSGGSPTPPSSGVPEGAVLVSAAALSALQADATAGAEARRLIRAQEVETELRSALSAGRIAPADVEHWRAELASNFDGARTLLSKLSAVFPTSELGSDQGDGSNTDAAFDEFLADVFGVAK